MATEDPGDSEKADDGLDPVTRALKAEADARKAIAEADAATAAARPPKVPSALPSTEVDASGLEASFATGNCYRAAYKCTHRIAAAVAEHLKDVAAPQVWVANADSTDSFDALTIVDLSLDDVEGSLQAAIDELEAFETPPEEVPPTSQDQPSDAMRNLVPALPLAAIAASAISSGLPLLFDALSTKMTIKSTAATLSQGALLDLMVWELRAQQRGEGQELIGVHRADVATPIDNALIARVQAARTTVHDLRGRARRAGNVLRELAASVVPRQAQVDLARAYVEASVKKDETTAYPCEDVNRVHDFAEALVADLTRISTLGASIAHANEVAAAADAALLAMLAAESGTPSLLRRASFAKRMSAHPSLYRLELTAVDAAASSTVVDYKIAHDRAIHVGSTTVTYRLSDHAGAIVCAGTLYDIAGSVLRLDNGTLEELIDPRNPH